MDHGDWMTEHLGPWAGGHWLAMGLGWAAIIAGLIAAGILIGRSNRKSDR